MASCDLLPPGPRNKEKTFISEAADESENKTLFVGWYQLRVTERRTEKISVPEKIILNAHCSAEGPHVPMNIPSDIRNIRNISTAELLRKLLTTAPVNVWNI